MTPDEARAEIVRLLELEPMGTRPDGRATWDDCVAYVAKRIGTAGMALASLRRRNTALAAALDLPADTPWPQMIDRVRLYRERVTEGGPPPTVDDQWANPVLEPPASATDETMPPLRSMRCPAPPVGCGHMFNRHDPDGQGCHVRIEVNHVNGVAGGFEVCGCTERRPS